MRPTKPQAGFSLIELLIVVAIIGIIAAIAIPNYQASRRASNEAAAISSLRTIGSAQLMYRQMLGNGVNFADSLSDLGPDGAALLDDTLGDADTVTKSGYEFTMAGGGATFGATANPSNPGATGRRFFFTNEPGVIRFNENEQADADDPAV